MAADVPAPNADEVFPRPERLPAEIAVGSPLLQPINCPSCGVKFLYAHCNSPACRALWCEACQVVYRPDLGTWFKRRPDEPERGVHPSSGVA